MEKSRNEVFDEMLWDLIKELMECELGELEQIRVDWMEELMRLGIGQAVIDLCSKLVDLVIEIKTRKEKEIA